MTTWAVILALICQGFLVGGNLLFKHAMAALDAPPGMPGRGRRMGVRLTLGLVLMTFWFLLWVGLMGVWNLSAIYPFEGLSPVLMVLGAWVFLGEKMGWRGWVGVGLVGAGVALVAGS